MIDCYRRQRRHYILIKGSIQEEDIAIVDVALVVKNSLANTRDLRDVGLIPGLGRDPGGGCGNPLQYSSLENPWKEEPGGLQYIGLQRVRLD